MGFESVESSGKTETGGCASSKKGDWKRSSEEKETGHSRNEMGVNVDGFIVEVEQRVKAVAVRRKGRDVAREDVVVVFLPFGEVGVSGEGGVGHWWERWRTGRWRTERWERWKGGRGGRGGKR